MIADSLLGEPDPVCCAALHASSARSLHVLGVLEAMLVLARVLKSRQTPG